MSREGPSSLQSITVPPGKPSPRSWLVGPPHTHTPSYWSISTENGRGGMGSGFVSSRTQSLSWRGGGGAEMDSCWVQRDKEWTELHQQSPESAESSGLACCTAQDFASSQGYRFSSDQNPGLLPVEFILILRDATVHQSLPQS